MAKNEYPRLTYQNLNNDIYEHIGSYLNACDILRYSAVNNHHFNLFQVPRAELITQKLFPSLLSASRSIKQKLLQINHSQCVPLFKTSGTEENDRKWKNISPLQFAAWSGDLELLLFYTNYIIKYYPKECLLAAQQLQDVKDGKLEHGSALAPYLDLIKAYSQYVVEYNRGTPGQKKKFWIEEIGGKQLQLPKIGLFYLFHPHFGTDPQFKFIESMACQELSTVRGKIYSYFNGGSKLGKDIAFINMGNERALENDQSKHETTGAWTFCIAPGPKVLADRDSFINICNKHSLAIDNAIQKLLDNDKTLLQKAENFVNSRCRVM